MSDEFEALSSFLDNTSEEDFEALKAGVLRCLDEANEANEATPITVAAALTSIPVPRSILPSLSLRDMNEYLDAESPLQVTETDEQRVGARLMNEPQSEQLTCPYCGPVEPDRVEYPISLPPGTHWIDWCPKCTAALRSGNGPARQPHLKSGQHPSSS